MRCDYAFALMQPELFTIPGINFPVPSYGAMTVLAFLLGALWATHRASKVKADPDILLNMSFIALVFGWLGARVFYVIHYWERFKDNPIQAANTCGGGFEVYGGLIGAGLVTILYLRWRKLSVRVYGDIIMPSLLLGMGIGRIGCFLYGCCWGGACSPSLPWAVQFPFASPPQVRHWENREMTIPAELMFIDPSGIGSPLPRQLLGTEKLAKLEARIDTIKERLEKARAENDQATIESIEKRMVPINLVMDTIHEHYDRFDVTGEQLEAQAGADVYRTRAVHPAQLYGAIGPILMALLLNAYFYRRTRHGMVVGVALVLYPIQRFFEEIIRSDNPLDTLGLTVSQGVSIAMLTTGILFILVLQKMPEKAPAAMVVVPPKPSKGKKAVSEEPSPE